MPDYNFLAHPTIADPAAAIRGAAETANALNANQAFKSRQAAGRAFQNSITADGTTDQQALMLGLKNDPQAALAAQDAAQAGLHAQGSEYELHMKRLTTLSNAMSALSAQYQGRPPQEAINQAIDSLAPSLRMQPQEVAQMKSRFGPDPAANGAALLQGHMANLQAQQALTATLPTNTTVDNGQQIEGGTQAPAIAGGGLNIGGRSTVQTYPSRSQLAGRTNVGVGPNGEPLQGPLSTVTPPNLGGPAVASPLGNGRLPPALQNPANQPSGPANNGVVPTGLGPAQTSAATETGGASAKAFQEITDQGVQSKPRAAVLDNMLADTRQFTTGPLADRIQKARAMAQRFGFQVDTTGLSASESFNKLAAQLASQQGAGSDARLNVAQNANPHADLSPGGVDLMLRQLRGNEDYLQARAKLAAAYPDTSDRRGFESKIGQALDPRAFQYDRMTAAQKGDYFHSLPDDKARDAFIENYNKTKALLK